MLFSSIVFLTVFLPLVLGIYAIARTSARNLVLLTASLFFYTWGSGRYVVLLIVSGLIAWGFGRAVGRRRERGESTTWQVAAATALLLAPLLFFKYAAFFSQNLNDLTGVVGWTSPTLRVRALPIGISFFTFQALSYVFDVARADAQPQRRARDFILYLALFPQLIAGPIVRYATVAAEIGDRRFGSTQTAIGLQLFVYGLAKKVIVADAVGAIAASVFGTSNPSTLAAWVAAIAYALQIYFDFSGYSDMAIGLGMVFGFHFPTNFRRPYSSLSVTDFWRRWHITLSDWFRDYVYIPLGGNRVSTSRAYFNLLVVFFLTALWHGAAWTFLAWGGLHALALTLERLTGRNHTATVRRPALARARTALLVIVFWVFFRAASMSDAYAMLTSMFSWQGTHISADLAANLTARAGITMALAATVFLLPRDFSGFEALRRTQSPVAAVVRPVAVGASLVASLALISSGSLSPFLYFQF